MQAASGGWGVGRENPSNSALQHLAQSQGYTWYNPSRLHTHSTPQLTRRRRIMESDRATDNAADKRPVCTHACSAR